MMVPTMSSNQRVQKKKQADSSSTSLYPRGHAPPRLASRNKRRRPPSPTLSPNEQAQQQPQQRSSRNTTTALSLSLVTATLFALLLINQSLKFQHDFAALRYNSRQASSSRSKEEAFVSSNKNDHHQVVESLPHQKQQQQQHSSPSSANYSTSTRSFSLAHITATIKKPNNPSSQQTTALKKKKNQETTAIPPLATQSPLDHSSSSSSLVHWKNRNYATHPVTAMESNRLAAAAAERAKQQQNRTTVITAAICHPTTFDETGTLSLEPFFAWVSYYRLLGFQHIFLWYEGNIPHIPRFDELAALPYVTLTEYHPNGENKAYHGQGNVERQCMGQARFAKNYDWALPLDVDEYLWFNQSQSIQDFLAPFEDNNYTYISIGKYHYTTLHAYNGTHDDSGFGLEQWPYTPGPYCWGRGGHSHCPTWAGRCKVLAKPSKFTTVEIHGTQKYHREPDGTHLDTSKAHFKEWTSRLYPPNASATIYHHDKESFHVTEIEQVNIPHLMDGHKQNILGQVKIDYDSTLHDWLQFVAQGCPAAAAADDDAATSL